MEGIVLVERTVVEDVDGDKRNAVDVDANVKYLHTGVCQGKRPRLLLLKANAQQRDGQQ